MNVLSLFDGISCGQLALKNENIIVDNYFSSEIDENAITITSSHFPNTIQLGDIKEYSSWDLPEIDLLLAGSPCPGFSRSGKRKYFNDDRSGLYFDFLKIKNKLNPKYFLLENVVMPDQYKRVIDNDLNTNGIKINSSLISAQNRSRLYWSNIQYPEIEDKGILLESIVGPYKGIWIYPRGNTKSKIRPNNGKSPTITASSWIHNIFLVNLDGTKRKFTLNQMEQLQTLPIDYTNFVKKYKRSDLIGNGWTVDLISHIFKGLK